jgi:hypothetical protein
VEEEGGGGRRHVIATVAPLLLSAMARGDHGLGHSPPSMDDCCFLDRVRSPPPAARERLRRGG